MSNIATEKSPASFIDLRRFALEENEGIAMPGVDVEDKFESNRRILELPPGPVRVGTFALECAGGVVHSHPADEFIIVVAGELLLRQRDQELVLSNGQCAVLQHGSQFSWDVHKKASVLFMRYQNSVASTRLILQISPSPKMEVSAAPASDLLIGPTPSCRSYVDHRSTDGEFICGTWDSTPYYRRAMSYRHYELMHLIDGSVTFQDEAGRSGTFDRGDIFLIEQHAKCSWESRKNVTKVYSVYKPQLRD